jgi:outer membrane murein-binding lipoprotein Lpp
MDSCKRASLHNPGLIDSCSVRAQKAVMFRPILVAALMGISPLSTAADDLKVSQLEQDVRELQRQIQALSRQIESQRLSPPATSGAPTGPREAPKPVVSATVWIDAARWQKIRPGMNEFDVIGILGPPTSMRGQEGGRVLFYAMELGSSGYLGGSVTLRDRSVVSVQVPRLQ